MSGELKTLLEVGSFSVQEVIAKLEVFDYSLLKHEQSNIRKTALMCLFASLTSIDHYGDSSIPSEAEKSAQRCIDAPLILKDDLVYLSVNSGENGLYHLHTSVSRLLRTNKSLLKNQLLAFQVEKIPKGSSIFAINKDRIKSLRGLDMRLDEIPDPLVTDTFCHVGQFLAKFGNFRYQRVGAGEEDLPSCSSSEDEEPNPITSQLDSPINLRMEQSCAKIRDLLFFFQKKNSIKVEKVPRNAHLNQHSGLGKTLNTEALLSRSEVQSKKQIMLLGSKQFVIRTFSRASQKPSIVVGTKHSHKESSSLSVTTKNPVSSVISSTIPQSKRAIYIQTKKVVKPSIGGIF